MNSLFTVLKISMVSQNIVELAQMSIRSPLHSLTIQPFCLLQLPGNSVFWLAKLGLLWQKNTELSDMWWRENQVGRLCVVSSTFSEYNITQSDWTSTASSYQLFLYLLLIFQPITVQLNNQDYRTVLWLVERWVKCFRTIDQWTPLVGIARLHLL